MLGIGLFPGSCRPGRAGRNDTLGKRSWGGVPTALAALATVTAFLTASGVHAESGGAPKLGPANTTVVSAAEPIALEERLAPGLPLTEDEKAAIARAKADPSPLNLGELASLRHGLALAYQDAAASTGDMEALRVGILYAASAVDLAPTNSVNWSTLGVLYSRYAPTEISAGFAAVEAFASASRAARRGDTGNSPARPVAAPRVLETLRDRLRREHLIRTYPGTQGEIYARALDETAHGNAAGADLEFLRPELLELGQKYRDLETRRARWRGRLSVLEKGPNDTTAVVRDNVSSQLSRLEREIAANRIESAQIEAWLRAASKTAPESPPSAGPRQADDTGPQDLDPGDIGEFVAPDKIGVSPRSALTIAREILSLSARPDLAEERSPSHPAGDAGVSDEVEKLLAVAHKAHQRALVEPNTAQTLADRDLIVRLTRLVARRSDAVVENTATRQDSGVPKIGPNPNAPPAPTLRIFYGSHARTRPQTDRDPNFARTGPVIGPVPLGAALTLKADVEVPSAEPQPWVGFAWVLYDLNRRNKGPVDLGNQVNLGKPIAFNAKGAVQLGGQVSDQPAKTTLRFDLKTGGLAPGPYEAVMAAFYLGANGTFNPDKALHTTILARAPFEIVEGEISVYADLPDRIASPGWSPLTLITSDWIVTPYTITVTLENLVFRDTGGEVTLSATGLSPLVYFGGIMTVPDAPAVGAAAVTVQITDARGRGAATTRRLKIGGPPQAVFDPGPARKPGLPDSDKAVEHTQ